MVRNWEKLLAGADESRARASTSRNGRLSAGQNGSR